jgi:AraC-like DNA-binding protein
MAQIFVEPESVSGIALQRRYRADGITPLPIAELRDKVESLACAYERRAPDGELFALSQVIVTSLAGEAPGPATTDPRIATAIAELKERLDASISLDSAAASVGLSPDRFRHLFIAETGIAFRPYILWLRLERALAAYVSGDSLTNAAQAGGFADSAHFSTTFRRMFGIAPVSVRPEWPFRSSSGDPR